ncbi:acetoin utilization protein AcuC [Candidatus Thorarchaeota archaeon]|nr:MAG: acetoin utilization protein AcuC [Candidatus Thorarchaeota archaeon]
MRGKLVYPYSDALLDYEFNQDHPLKPERLKLTYLLSKELGLLDRCNVFEPTIASKLDLEMFHSPEYIDSVIKCGSELCSDPRHGLGTADNPVFTKIYETGARYVGATLDAMKKIIEGASNAFCISGGLHHAHKNAASGFCIFNDVAIAINHLRKKKDYKVLYFDIDAHHGDGVQNAFYRSNEVMTISIHQTGKTLFPGTGFVYETGGAEGTGYAINVPVIPGAGSLELIKVYEEIVVPLFESFRPDLLVTQLGVDGHYMDPLAHLAYTSFGYETVLKSLRKLSSNNCELGWLAVGGGGYNPVNVARLWTLFLSIILDEKLPEKMPEEFANQCSSMGFTRCPDTIRDKEDVVQMYFSRGEVTLDLDRTIRRVKELVFPYHGI